LPKQSQSCLIRRSLRCESLAKTVRLVVSESHSNLLQDSLEPLFEISCLKKVTLNFVQTLVTIMSFGDRFRTGFGIALTKIS